MASIAPFLKLARIDKPVGSVQIFFPYLYGFYFTLITESARSHPLETSPLRTPIHIPLLLLSSVLLRSAGCVWNDIVDVEIDRVVERTRCRPLACRMISVNAAHAYLGILTASWAMTLNALVDDPKQTLKYTIPLVLLVTTYPYAKRVTYYAQVFLGITVGWGVIFGAAIAGFDTIGTITTATQQAVNTGNLRSLLGPLQEPRVTGLLSLYTACVTWTIIYDTIYAFQDVADDRRVGVKSLALRISAWAKSFLGGLSVLHTLLLTYTGVTMNLDLDGNLLHLKPWSLWPYVVLSVFGGSACLVLMIMRVELEVPRSCAWWFKNGSSFVSLMIGCGLVTEYAIRQSLEMQFPASE